MPIRKQRSIIHIGTGQTNIFQWEDWQLYGAIKIPTWYIITIINGPIRTRKTAIHFFLEHQLSYLTVIPGVMLSDTLFPNHTMMAYHKGNKYCERLSSALTDMHNAQYVQQKQYKNCYNYHNNTNICAKTQEPQCKFAVGSLKTAMEKPGILLDIEENKPSIAYSNACFLPTNYTIYGNVTRIHDSPRTRREVTLASVILISVLMGALIASIIEVQIKTYNDMVNKKLEDLENKFTLQLNQVKDQVTNLQIQQLELANAIATLSRVMANLANKQQRFENFVLAFNRQLLEQQIITTRRSIENRKLISSQNAHAIQLAIKEYNARKLILQALKKLKNIPSLRNDTIYRNQITEGIIYNTEIYRLIKQDHQNFTKWVKEHPLILRNQSQ